MSPLDVDQFYNLLPALYRLRDVEQGGPLRDLLEIIFEQSALVQEGLDQSYDDQFIETCAEWVVPYLGALVGARPLHTPDATRLSQRAVVANTLGYRRRKGTLAVLEQLARDVTNYPAAAVEFFQRLATTQAMNHPRPENVVTADLRRPDLLERIDTAFDRAAHTLEVRRVVDGRGRYNISNIGLFLFRLQAMPLLAVTARRVDDRRYTFNPLGIDAPLFNRPETETLITDFAGPRNVPMPISRRAMGQDKSAYYGQGSSLLVQIGGADVPAADVVVCNLADKTDGSGDWAHAPADKLGIDPVLGRIALPGDDPPPGADQVLVTFHHGFSDTIGGGAYERASTLAAPATVTLAADGPALQSALDDVTAGAVLEFQDSRTYALDPAEPNMTVPADARVDLRAANEQRPLIAVQAAAGPPARHNLMIHGESGAVIVLNGLLLEGGLTVTGTPAAVTLVDCTLTPGLARTRTNAPRNPELPSLVVTGDDVAVTLTRCISGPLQVANGATVTIRHSLVDAGDPAAVAYMAPPDAPDATAPGGRLTLEESTVIGRIYAQALDRVSNAIIVAESPGPGVLPVRAEQTQEGCVRFSYLPLTSRAPRRYRCQPTRDAPDPRVHFTSRLFGAPGYGQLSRATPASIRQGADDESEMGVFHDLYQPQREANLRIMLEEYLRFGLEAGIFYST